MNHIFERTIGLIGNENFKNITNKTITIIGLGGVGGTALECLARTGFCNFILVDFDIVSESNLNRQILYTYKDIGNYKVEVAKNKILSINPNASIKTYNKKFDANFNLEDTDFVIDAIDDISGKIEIVKLCNNKNIPFIMSLGMANKLNVKEVCISTLNKTCVDPLARKMRYELKKRKININDINVIYSKEQPNKNGTCLNSTIQVPSTAGILISSFVLNYFCK